MPGLLLQLWESATASDALPKQLAPWHNRRAGYVLPKNLETTTKKGGKRYEDAASLVGKINAVTEISFMLRCITIQTETNGEQMKSTHYRS